MTNLVLGHLILESLTPSVNASLGTFVSFILGWTSTPQQATLFMLLVSILMQIHALEHKCYMNQ
jgi:hypothetical protein